MVISCCEWAQALEPNVPKVEVGATTIAALHRMMGMMAHHD
jgi:hypothetical protein